MSAVFLVFAVSISHPASAAESTGRVDPTWREALRCGPNCIYVMLWIHGRRVPYDRLLSEFPIDERGTNAQELTRVSEKFGLPLCAVRTTPLGLAHISLPAVVHLRTAGDSGHFVILISANSAERRFAVLDCTTGAIDNWSFGDFSERFSGVALVTEESPDLDTLAAWTSAILSFIAAVFAVRSRRRRPSPITEFPESGGA